MKELRTKITVPRVLCWMIELILMTSLFFLLHSGGMKKYVLLLVFSGIFSFLGRKKKWQAEAVVCVALPVISYLLLGGISTLLSANPQMQSVKDLLFWVVPMVFVCALYVFFGDDIKRIVDFQFVGSCITYLYSYKHWLQWYGKAEDSFAFVFGAFTVYYVYKKRWPLVPIAMLLMYFADKKIAFLAVAGAVAVLLILWIFKKSRILAMTIWSLGISGIFYYIYSIHSGVLKHFCYSVGVAGNGRLTMYDRFKDMYEFSPRFFGNGLGNIKNILDCWAIPTYDHLHNDLLKFYFELGFLGFMIFMISYGITFYLAEKKFGKSQMSGLLAMAVHSMILFMTDNVSVYVLYLVPVYCICFAMIVSEEKQGMCLYKKKIHDKIK